MKLLPLGDRVLLRPAKRESRTPSGLVIPETARDAAVQHGEVLAVGVVRDARQSIQHATNAGADITHLRPGHGVYFRNKAIIHPFDDGSALVDADDLLAVVAE